MGTRLLIEVHYKVKEGLRDEFLQKVKEAGIAEETRKESGNGRYEFLYPASVSDQLVLLEIWDTAEDQEKHTKTAHYKKLFELKEQYVVDTEVQKSMFEHMN